MIKVVGIGLDGAIGLSQNVQDFINQSTLLVGSERHLSYFNSHPAEKIVIKNFSHSIEQINQAKKTHKNIVILVTGDPLFFGLGRLLLEYFSSEELEFYPHFSCVQLAFNRLKVPWQDAKIVSGHGRELDELTTLLKQGVEKIAILTDKNNNPSAISRLYLSLNLPDDYDFWVCENLGDNTEKIQRFSGQELAKKNAKNFASLNVVILLQNSKNNLSTIDNNKLPLLGLPDHLFLTFQDRPGLITKREIRINILGELALQNQQVVWDIGAGTGSVSIEIARLCPDSQIYALEKTAIGIILIKKNCQRFNILNIIPVPGKAPDSLTNLPQPHRIFIGGSGGNIISILEVCKEKLANDGILVMALATLENLAISIDWFKEKSWDYRLLNVQISQSVSIVNLTRFSPLNPVILLRATPMNRGEEGFDCPSAEGRGGNL